MSLNPLPVQGYADGIVIATHNELTSQEIIHASEPIMHKANLDIKASKYGVFYERPSRNNWYKGNMTKNQKLPSKINKLLFRNANEEIISTYKVIVEKLCICQLPLTFKSVL